MHKSILLASLFLGACGATPTNEPHRPMRDEMVANEPQPPTRDETVANEPQPPTRDETVATEPEPPVRGETPDRACNDENLDSYVGRARSGELETELRRKSGATIVRWVPKGAMITMEFRSNRLTVWLDANKRIERVNCG